MSIYLSIYLSVCLSVCLSICLSIYRYIAQDRRALHCFSWDYWSMWKPAENNNVQNSNELQTTAQTAIRSIHSMKKTLASLPLIANRELFEPLLPVKHISADFMYISVASLSLWIAKFKPEVAEHYCKLFSLNNFTGTHSSYYTENSGISNVMSLFMCGRKWKGLCLVVLACRKWLID